MLIRITMKLALSSMILGLGLLAASGCKNSGAPADGGVDLQLDLLAADVTPAPDGPPALKVGDFLEFKADEAGKIIGATSVTGTEKFMVLLLSLDVPPRKSHQYSAQVSSSQPMRLSEEYGASPAGIRRPRRRDFGAEVNAILASHPTALRAPKPWQAATLPPKVGDKRDFLVDNGNYSYVTITAECQAVDAVAAYWVDQTTTPVASISATLLGQVSDGFSKVALPRLRAYFGHESDVNGDGLVGVLFTPLVSKVGAGTIAYVSPCDLIDPGLVHYCGGSNQMELLYVQPPDSTSPWAQNPRVLLETVSHEFQHAIYFYRKFIAHNNLDAENPYITEGLSGLAQDLAGYNVTLGLGVWAALEYVDEFSVPNFTSNAVHDYFTDPELSSLHYSAAYLFMRYLFDRAGGDKLDANGVPQDAGGMSWLHNAVDNAATGFDGLTAAAGVSNAEATAAFWTAMAVSNRGPNGTAINSDPKLNFQPTTTDPITQRQRGVNLFGRVHGQTLAGPATQALGSADGQVWAGGAEFLTLDANPEQPILGFTIQTPPAANARVRLIRIQ